MFSYFVFLCGDKELVFVYQIKDMAVKASGAYKNCKPCSRSSNNNKNRKYADSDVGSDSARFHMAYHRTGSSNSTPRMWGKEMEARLKGLSSGEGTPASVSGRTESVMLTEEDEPREWIAQVEPGVLITFVSLPQGGNDLKRIRFRYYPSLLYVLEIARALSVIDSKFKINYGEKLMRVASGCQNCHLVEATSFLTSVTLSFGCLNFHFFDLALSTCLFESDHILFKGCPDSRLAASILFVLPLALFHCQ